MTPLDAVLERPDTSSSLRGAPAMAAAGYRVLVADDEPAIVEAVRLLLTTHDFSIVAAASPTEALARVAAEPVDVALIDLNYDKGRTTGEQGLDLVSSLRKHAPTVPIIVMTAWSSIELALEAVRRGAREFLQKPFDETRLVAVVRSHAELGRALRRVADLESEVRHLKIANGTADNGSSPAMRLHDVEGMLVRRAMERHEGNISRAARALGLSRSALYRRLERHKI
jgi:DNA-binding NtrC family response regulator